jgi:aminoethylphosphonate catabolism LysR family transcriptional regulator
MTPSQLRAFHLVAQEGGFSAAANSAMVSQPTISSQVRQLEEEYKVRLFERRARSVDLTEMGQALYAVTTRLFAAEAEANSLLSGAKTLIRGNLRIAGDSAYHVMPALAALRRQHQGIRFSLRIGNSADVLQQVLDFNADIGVMAKLVSDPRLHSLEIKRDQLVLFVPTGHAWAKKKRMGLRDLDGQDLVVRERGSVTREVFENALARAGATPAMLSDVQTREGVREAVAAGFGIGVVFRSEFGTDPRFHPIAIADAEIEVSEYAVCLRDSLRLAPVRAFMDAIEHPTKA